MKILSENPRDKLKYLFYSWSDSSNFKRTFLRRITKPVVLGLTIATIFAGKSAYQEFQALREYRVNSHLSELEKRFKEGGAESASRFDSENYQLYQETLNNYFAKLNDAKKNRQVSVKTLSLLAILSSIGLAFTSYDEKRKRKKIEDYLANKKVKYENLDDLGTNLERLI